MYGGWSSSFSFLKLSFLYIGAIDFVNIGIQPLTFLYIGAIEFVNIRIRPPTIGLKLHRYF